MKKLEHPTETPFSIRPLPDVLTSEHIAPEARIFASRAELVASIGYHVSRIAEVGVWKGEFSQALLDGCDPSELHLFEADSSRIPKKLLQDHRVTLHKGDSSTELGKVEEGYFDLIYIDADHSYEGVRKDADEAKVKIRRGGILVFNDYTLWSMLQMMPYGVIQNVNRLCVEEGFEVIAYSFQFQGYPDVAIRRRK